MRLPQVRNRYFLLGLHLSVIIAFSTSRTFTFVVAVYIALDNESESIVQAALDKLMASNERTIVVIAHRVCSFTFTFPFYAYLFFNSLHSFSLFFAFSCRLSGTQIELLSLVTDASKRLGVLLLGNAVFLFALT
jgi:hypothetical protein